MEAIKENAAPGICGAIIGAFILLMVGFGWGGWVTTGTANQMAKTAIIDQLVPICVGQFNMDSDKAAKLAEMKKGDSWKRGDFVAKQGWATMPGSTEINDLVAENCAVKIVS